MLRDGFFILDQLKATWHFRAMASREAFGGPAWRAPIVEARAVARRTVDATGVRLGDAKQRCRPWRPIVSVSFPAPPPRPPGTHSQTRAAQASGRRGADTAPTPFRADRLRRAIERRRADLARVIGTTGRPSAETTSVRPWPRERSWRSSAARRKSVAPPPSRNAIVPVSAAAGHIGRAADRGRDAEVRRGTTRGGEKRSSSSHTE
jgi:hypothetical protein